MTMVAYGYGLETVIVRLPVNGVVISTQILLIALLDAARIINLPATLSIALALAGFTPTLAGVPSVAIGETAINVEICLDE